MERMHKGYLKMLDNLLQDQVALNTDHTSNPWELTLGVYRDKKVCAYEVGETGSGRRIQCTSLLQ